MLKNILITNGVSEISPNFIKNSDKFTILGVGRFAKVKD